MIGKTLPYQETIQQVRSALENAFAALDASFAYSDEVRMYEPQDGGWSIDEILEHVTLTNHYLLIIIRKGCIKALRKFASQQAILAGESDLERLAPIGHPDAFRWFRPEHMEPTRQQHPEMLRVLLSAQRSECLDLLRQMSHGEGTLYTVCMSVNALGKMDMYQWLYFLALHARRHIAQIECVWEEMDNNRSQRE